MRSYEADEFGIPILKADEIEFRAEETISHFDGEVLRYPTETPVVAFVEKLHRESFLTRDYERDLGYTKLNKKILGKTRFKPISLLIDCSLVADRRFRFVLSHELGHIVLHRGVDLAKSGYAAQEMVDTEYDIVTGKKNLSTPRDWLEWQANRFAAAILMPQKMVRTAVLAAQRQLGINRNIGQIIVHAEQSSISDYYSIRKKLEDVFNVNSTNIEYRLKDLDILVDHRNRDFVHISQVSFEEGK